MRHVLVAALLMLTALAVVALPAQAAPDEPMCMPVYSKTTIGPITIVRRDSCHAEYYVCDRTPGEALDSPTPLDCVANVSLP